MKSGANASESVLVRTKLYRPPARADLVCRPRLHEQLSRGVQMPLTLVLAPAGYGKSLAISHWLESIDMPSAWLSLDTTESDATEFLRYLVAAVRMAFPTACSPTAALLSAGYPVLRSELSAQLLNDLDDIDTPFVLLLDDYYRLRSESEVHQVMRQLLDHPPRPLRLVISSRRAPPLQLDLLRARGQLTELSAATLRFTDAEAAALLRSLTGLTLSGDDLDQLQHAVEGWAVGLRLVALALSRRQDASAFLRGLDQGEGAVREYLIQDVIAAQGAAMQDWILKTSVLGRFCAELCMTVCAPDAGTPALDGQTFIDELVRAGLFTIPLDAEGHWFRYHHQFRREMRKELRRRLDPAGCSALHRRACTWFADAGLIDEAIEHALAGGDAPAAAALVEAYRCDERQLVPWYLSAKWLPRLPLRLRRERPGLRMAQAWMHYGQCNFAEIPPLIAGLESVSTDLETDPLLLGELSFFRGHAAFHRGEDAVSIGCFEDALARIPERYEDTRSIVQVHYAVNLQRVGRAETALRYIRQETGPGDARVSSARDRALASLVMVLLLEADLFAVQREVELRAGPDGRGFSGPMEAWWWYFSARVRFQQGDYAEALRLLESNAQSRFLLYRRSALDSLAMRAIAAQAVSKPARATEALELMRDLAARSGDVESAAITRSCEARVALMAGDLERARTCMEAVADGADQGYMVFWVETPRLTRCRLMLAEGSAASIDAACTLVEGYEQENRASHNRIKLIEVLALKALIRARQARTEQAIVVLQEALTLARPGGVIQLFAELGQPMAELMAKLDAEDYQEASFVRSVMRQLHDTASDVPEQDSVDLGDPLTRRERQILELLVQRLSDKEIAQQLDVSPQTVNSHLKRIYRKLNVNTRRLAAEKALANWHGR